MNAPNPHAAPAPIPPQAVLGQIINGYWATFTVCAAARLGLADELAKGPSTVSELANRVGAEPASLYRLLRACASLGIFSEGPAKTFSQTPLSEPLRTGVPGSMHGLAAMTSLLHARAWPEIVHSVRTGKTAFEKVFGKEIFDYLPGDPEGGRAFDAAMASYTAVLSGALAQSYDFSPFRTIVDVGGGNGALLAAILGRTPTARGVNFDLPQVADRAKTHLAGAGLVQRCEVIGGSFFESVPPGGDAYTLKMILHDWDDERSIAILRNVRKVTRPEARLLVMEAVLPEGNAPSPGKLLDINMLVMTGGRERTEAEFRQLLGASGFEIVRIVPAHPTIAVVEARPI